MKQMITVMDYMEWELQLRHTALPGLCRIAGEKTTGVLKKIFSSLAQELEAGAAADSDACMRSVLKIHDKLPAGVTEAMELFGSSMGMFDLESQIQGLKAVKQECHRQLAVHQNGQEERIRSYQTLGVCAGAGIAILLI